VQRYNLSYRDLKTLARNSLHYSFVPGQSLWNAPSYQAFHPPAVPQISRAPPASPPPAARC